MTPLIRGVGQPTKFSFFDHQILSYAHQRAFRNIALSALKLKEDAVYHKVKGAVSGCCLSSCSQRRHVRLLIAAWQNFGKGS